MVPTCSLCSVDAGKATWKCYSMDHGSLPSVHIAKHFNVGMYHVWYLHAYCTTMAPTDLVLLYTMDTYDIPM
jgi:hypothetical protein